MKYTVTLIATKIPLPYERRGTKVVVTLIATIKSLSQERRWWQRLGHAHRNQKDLPHRGGGGAKATVTLIATEKSFYDRSTSKGQRF